jgi:hypothetical protein
MPTTSEKLLKALRIACVLATYGLAGVLLMQPNNRYAWMATRAGELPLDDDSPGRVLILATLVAVAALVTLGLSLKTAGRRSPAMWLSMLPLGYAAWRVAGVCLAST